MRRLSLCLLWATVLVTGAQAADDPAEVVERYIRCVADGQVDRAQALWSPTFLASCARLGIVYRDEAYAFDLASPLHTLRAEIEAGRCRVEVGSPVTRDSVVAVPISVVGGSPVPAFLYGVVREDGNWRLAGQIWAVGQRWARYESEFFTIFSADPSRLDRAACAELDRFVAQVAAKLELAPSRVAKLRAVKIPYYLCPDETIATLTGYATKGMADLASGAVISSHFPHFHEVAHLLVNFALADVALYPLPILQEGLACSLGGRWGRAPLVVLHTGWVNAALDMGNLGEILTRDGFLSAAGGPDVTYAYAAVLCDLIVDRVGWPGLLALQEDLAGNLGDISQLTARDIAATISSRCGWATQNPVAVLEAEFAQWLPRFRRAGVVPGDALDDLVPANAEKEEGAPVQIRRSQEGPVFMIRRPEASLVILASGAAAADGPVSPVCGGKFAEILPGRAHAGEPFGIRCTDRNISVYDFVANQLVGIWVADFTAENGLTDAHPERFAFRVDRGVIPDTLLAEDRWQIVQP